MKERNDYTINHIYIYNDIQENGERDKLEKECGQKLNADAALNYIPRILFIFSFISRENFDMLQYSSKRNLKKFPRPIYSTRHSSRTKREQIRESRKQTRKRESVSVSRCTKQSRPRPTHRAAIHSRCSMSRPYMHGFDCIRASRSHRVTVIITSTPVNRCERSSFDDCVKPRGRFLFFHSTTSVSLHIF